MDEATNPLTILATGLYGHEMPNQNGAPIRLVVPWKYGFKSIKSIVCNMKQETMKSIKNVISILDTIAQNVLHNSITISIVL